MPQLTRITQLNIEKYRSIREQICIEFPEDLPLVLVGENNAGKSNIIRALEVVLGESWPGSHIPEDHEFWQRTPENGPISIEVSLNGVIDNYSNKVNKIMWKCQNPKHGPDYKAVYASGSKFVNKQIIEQCTVVVIGADRRLSYQMSYATKWTLLSKLMHRFHTHLIADEKRTERLKDKFIEIKEIFEEVAEFSGFQKELKQNFDNMMVGMTYGLGIDFSAYDPSNYFHSLKVFPNEGEEPRNFEELGTGQEQLLAIAFAHAYAKAFYGGIILVIEEPEAHLHPLAQQWLGKRIRGMASDGLQIVISTHSPSFIDILDLPGIVLVRKVNNATQVTQITTQQLTAFCKKHGAPAEVHSILPFYSSNATREIQSGFFAKKIVLVEGSTEQLALPIYLEKVGLDTENSGIAVIPVMGRGNLAKWWRFFSAYDIPIYLIFDNDDKEDSKGSKRQDILNTLGFSDPNMLQEFLTATDWVIDDKCAVFGKDFETTMRRYFSKYDELENEARDKIGSTKPLIARYVAQKLLINDIDKVGWDKYRDLMSKIQQLGEKQIAGDATNQGDEYDLDVDYGIDDDIPF